MDSNVTSVLITAITMLGGTAAWRYYERRAAHKEKDEDFIRHDCRDRITKLEALLEASAREKDDLRGLILELTREVAELRVKVEYLTDENEKLERGLKARKSNTN
jgi:predicted RNase H-like nuclease (RuvC/YqgF family)